MEKSLCGNQDKCKDVEGILYVEMQKEQKEKLEAEWMKVHERTRKHDHVMEM